MSKLGINTGNNPNDGQGDPLRVAMGKINNNFTEIYDTLGDGNNVISYVNTAGIATVAENLTGNPIINVGGILNSGITTTEHLEVRNIDSTGIITAIQFSGDGSQLTNVTSTASGVSIYDDGVLLGVAREIDFDVDLVSTSPDGTQRVRVSSQASYATTAGIATYATTAGYASIAGYAFTAGISTVARGLTGTPNLNVGVVTATSFVGDGSQLTGIVTSIVAGTNITISGSTGQVTINSTASGGGGIGTDGSVNTTGIITASAFVGDGSGLTGIIADSAWVDIDLPGGTFYDYGQSLGIHTAKHVGIGTTARSSSVLYIDAATVGIAGTPYGLRVDGSAEINNVRFKNTTAGFTGFLFPSFQNIVGGDGNGYYSALQYNQLSDAPFHIRSHSKFTRTVQIGTSFYDLGSGPIDYPAIFMDGGTATIAVGLGITINGGTGIITATGFSGGAAGVNVSGAVTATSFYGDGSNLTGVTVVGYATTGYVDAAVSGISLTDLSDVNAGGPSTGQVLKWSGTEWTAAADLTAAGGSGIGLTDLSVTISASGINSLTYNNTTGVFNFTPTSLTGLATEGYVDAAVSTKADLGGATFTGVSTFQSGAVVTGVLTATSFVGDGSGLTNLPGGAVGSAGTWAVNAAGIHTTKNVGIGTELSSSALTVEGDGRFSGVVTATRFESQTAGTPTLDSPNNLNINAITVAISTDLSVGGDAYVGVDTSSGLILTSPNGTQYRLVVDNSGNLSTVLVP